jgi:hypothetical protein
LRVDDPTSEESAMSVSREDLVEQLTGYSIKFGSMVESSFEPIHDDGAIAIAEVVDGLGLFRAARFEEIVRVWLETGAPREALEVALGDEGLR